MHTGDDYSATQQDGEEIFRVTASRGFLPSADPLPRLPVSELPFFGALESLADNLPGLLVAGGPSLRREVRRRLDPLVDGSTDMATLLPKGMGSAVEERLLLVLSFIAHAYVWGRPGDPPMSSLPPCLSRPWVSVSQSRHRPPILTYASFNLYNWATIDHTQPVCLGNVHCVTNFLGGLDEEWFRLVHLEIEAKAARAVAAMIHYTQHRTRLCWVLQEIAHTLQDMQASLARVTEHCDPCIYYQRVRLYMGGWRDNPALPQGLWYEGVDEEGQPRHYYGETGAQSCIIPALDAFLGLEHQHDEMQEYLCAMRAYAPLPHRQFVHSLSSLTPSVRHTVLAAATRGLPSSPSSSPSPSPSPLPHTVPTLPLPPSSPSSPRPPSQPPSQEASPAPPSASGALDLVCAYNACLRELGRFRALHLTQAHRYIRAPALAIDKGGGGEGEDGRKGRERGGRGGEGRGGRGAEKGEEEEEEGEENGEGDDDDVPESARVGTGGSDFMVFLRRIHTVTLRHVVDMGGAGEGAQGGEGGSGREIRAEEGLGSGGMRATGV